MLEKYLATISTPMHCAKAKAALTQLTRHNSSERVHKRHELIAEMLENGAKVVDHKGKMVLLSPNGAWLDTRNITKRRLAGYTQHHQARLELRRLAIRTEITLNRGAQAPHNPHTASNNGETTNVYADNRTDSVNR